MKRCKICRIRLTEEEAGTCDPCWYGMRLDAKNWIEDLKARGIEVERGMGCVPVPGVGFVCGDPYRRKVIKPPIVQDKRFALVLGLLILFVILLSRR